MFSGNRLVRRVQGCEVAADARDVVMPAVIRRLPDPGRAAPLRSVWKRGAHHQRLAVLRGNSLRQQLERALDAQIGHRVRFPARAGELHQAPGCRSWMPASSRNGSQSPWRHSAFASIRVTRSRAHAVQPLVRPRAWKRSPGGCDPPSRRAGCVPSSLACLCASSFGIERRREQAADSHEGFNRDERTARRRSPGSHCDRSI